MTADERREQLVEAAIRVMARDGVPRATTRSIVAEADMPLGVFHYCFRSKEELVIEVMEAINDRSYTAVGEVLTRVTEPEPLVREAIATYWAHIEKDPDEHLLTYELTQYALRQTGQEKAARRQYANYLTGMEDLLEAMGQVAGFTWGTPVPALSRYVLAVIEGVTFQWLVDRDSGMAQQTLARLGDHLVEAMVLPA